MILILFHFEKTTTLSIITFNPDQHSGQPCIRGMRITVGDILSYLASGMSMEEIIEYFPSLTSEDIYAALTFASNQLNQTAHIKTA